MGSEMGPESPGMAAPDARRPLEAAPVFNRCCGDSDRDRPDGRTIKSPGAEHTGPGDGDLPTIPRSAIHGDPPPVAQPTTGL